MNQITERLCSGAIVLVSVAAVQPLVPDAEALARSRIICEEWRDYYYNVETGAFIEWVGDPYMMCYSEDEPISRPESPDPDYHGGWGTPRDPRVPTCEHCKDERDDCIDSVNRGTSRCMEHYRNEAHTWCVQFKRKKGGEFLEGGYRCFTTRGPDGKPVRDCEGPGITDCEESFAQDQPGRSIANAEKVNIGHDWWGVGGDRTSTVTWGGSRGYAEGCRLARQEAGEICLANLSVCEESAGGCR